jgi:hypothetical protein
MESSNAGNSRIAVENFILVHCSVFLHRVPECPMSFLDTLLIVAGPLPVSMAGVREN